MREIKFRAWDSDAECFAYSHIEDENYVWGFGDGKLKAWAIVEVPATEDEPPYADSVELEPPDICTGLKDDKKTDIYAGDIVRYGEHKDCYEILWWEEQTCFVTNEYKPITKFWASSVNVVGNRVENPGLLEPANV